MTVAVCPTRPDSRGEVIVKSPDPLERPAIRFNYLEHRSDLDVITKGVAITRRILGSPAFAPYVVGETKPGDKCVSDDDIETFARGEGSSIYHPVGTCKMGVDDRAVVDPRLKVRGLAGLRVADASIMPFLTTGNTNAPTIMIAEKAAQMIREDALQGR
jgi:choline dehydrogenase